jgi:hypothetical protein
VKWLEELLANRPCPPRPALLANTVLRPLPLVTTTGVLLLVVRVETWREPPVRAALVVWVELVVPVELVACVVFAWPLTT